MCNKFPRTSAQKELPWWQTRANSFAPFQLHWFIPDQVPSLNFCGSAAYIHDLIHYYCMEKWKEWKQHKWRFYHLNKIQGCYSLNLFHIIIHFLPHRCKQAIVQLQFSQIWQIHTCGNKESLWGPVNWSKGNLWQLQVEASNFTSIS